MDYSIYLSNDFTTWTAGALSDFDGKANTTIIAANSSDARDICTVLNTFNTASDGSNAGKSDWYVPACGQLALMYLAFQNINAVLEKIGGTVLVNEGYWSSTEKDDVSAWHIHMDEEGLVNTNYYKDIICYMVRYVRDIE